VVVGLSYATWMMGAMVRLSKAALINETAALTACHQMHMLFYPLAEASNLASRSTRTGDSVLYVVLPSRSLCRSPAELRGSSLLLLPSLDRVKGPHSCFIIALESQLYAPNNVKIRAEAPRA
jgi:hypothetical protein